MNKSLFFVVVAMAIFTLCFAEVQDRRRGPGGRPSGPGGRPGGPGPRPGGGSQSCTSNADCRFGVCDTATTNQCVMCLADSDCTKGDANTCDNNRCVECIGDSDCTDSFCFLGGRCLPQLSTGATCITNAWCSSGTCTSNVCA